MRELVQWWRDVLVLVLAACLLCARAPVQLHAQSAPRTTLSGTVLDPDGKVIVEAALIVRAEGSGDAHQTTTDASGRFVLTGLPEGLYTIEVAVPGFELVRRTGIQVAAGKTEDISIRLTLANIVESVTVSAALPAAAVAAPSQSSLTARSAQSLISNEYVRNYTSPISDFSQVIQMAPGTFSVSANGPGLSDTKTFFRGFADGFYSMTFDGIPFNDTNDPTHHSWVFFPAQTIGSTVFDRSPGTAATIGPSTYGGSVNLLSRSLPARQEIAGTISYGSFNTRLFEAEFDSGQLGGSGRSRLLVDAHMMRSDGYQTYNDQRRNAFSAKYQFAKSSDTVFTGFASVMNLQSNTPNQKGATRSQIAQFGDNFLMTGDPASPLYYRYNFYNIPTHFEYFGVRTDLGHGWSLDDKVYTMGYHNKQNYNGATISATSATDKLNSYWKVGNILPVTYVAKTGVFRTGLWTEYASTDRYQTPSDPRTWVDAALPNFHEMFGTTTVQPYAEYSWKAARALTITPGIKFAYYKQDFTQFADNGKTVGNLGGAPFVEHAAEYHSWLPSFDAHYLIHPFWSVYAQYGQGQNVPPTSIFDVQGANVAIVPKPILTNTGQVGSVWKSNRATLDVNYYYIHFENNYTSTVDPVTGETNYYLSSQSVTKGFEAESTILVGGGFAVYLNGTFGSARYTDTLLWVPNAPSDIETIGATYNRGSWNLGFFSKRIGQMYNDNSSIHQAVAIEPFDITNLFLNYTLRGASRFSETKVRFAINNLTDNHSITGVTPASAKSSAPAPGDILTLMSARSVSVSVTFGFSGGSTP
jgi:iron complex outermembrane receptor protein